MASVNSRFATISEAGILKIQEDIYILTGPTWFNDVLTVQPSADER